MRIHPIFLATTTLCALTLLTQSTQAQNADGVEISNSKNIDVKSTIQCADGTCQADSASTIGKRKGHHRGAGGRRQGFENAPGGGHGPMARIQAIKALPSLTPEQSQQVDSIVSAFKADVKPLKQQVQSLHAQVNPANQISSGNATAGSPEDAKVASARTQLQELRQQLKAKAKETMQKILAVLTPEQKQQLKQQRSNAPINTPTPSAFPATAPTS